MGQCSVHHRMPRALLASGDEISVQCSVFFYVFCAKASATREVAAAAEALEPWASVQCITGCPVRRYHAYLGAQLPCLPRRGHIHAHAHTHTHTHMRMHTHAHTHTHTHAHALHHVHTHIHTHMHAHTHARANVLYARTNAHARIRSISVRHE